MSRQRVAQGVLLVSLLAGAVLRLMFKDDGIYWPDEIYQSFEPAHRAVFGYGLVAWEFIEGARSWALPGFVALIMKVTSLFTSANSTAYLDVVKIVFALMSVGTALGSARLARTFGADSLLASVAAALCSFAVLSIYFAPRAMSENAGAFTMVWGLALALQPGASRKLLIAGCSLLGMSVLFRLQMASVCIGLVLLLALRRDWKTLGIASATLAVWAILFGALDAFTWHDAPNAKFGGWFHSAVVYVRFNVIEGKAADWGTAPWTFYFRFLWSSMPAITVAFAIGVLLSFKTARGLLLISACFLALHLASPHKELRFLVPMLPLLSALVATGLSAVPLPKLQGALIGVMLVIAIASAATANSLTMGQLGAYLDRPQSSAWNDFGNVNRLLRIASTHDDICGMMIGVHLAWTGGSSYLHRNVPIYMPGMAASNAYFNYAIIGSGGGGEVLAEDNGLQLVRIPGMQCQKDPGYSWRLP